MRNLIYSMMVSLDGFVARPNGDLDWVTVDEELHRFVNDQQVGVDAYLYGRGMYATMAAFWPTAHEDPSAPDYIVEFARIWQNMPKVVFSKTLDRVEGNTLLVRENAAAEIARLKAQPGKDLALGGSTLAASLMAPNLIDEYGLFVQPVILGTGKTMFPDQRNPLNVRLVGTRAFGSGVVYLRYLKAAATG